MPLDCGCSSAAALLHGPAARLRSCVPAFVRCAGSVLALVALVLVPGAAETSASERYALIVTGASGGPQYAEKYDTWRSSIVQTLVGRMRMPEEHVLELAEEEVFTARKATRENVRAAVADLRRRATKDDVVFVLLIGHGSGSDPEDAKFNLVGPDMNAMEWAALLETIPGRLVFVNAASGSFGFVEALSGRGRIVVTANDSGAQQFETVFPEHLVAALREESADFDKNGRTSVWEWFSYTSAAVKGWYEQRGQLATERALLDDDGDGVGRLYDGEGRDGILAKTTYIAAEEPIADTGDPELTARLRRKAEINRELEELRARKQEMLPEDYERQLEQLLLELARLDRQLRSKS
jgi:hypothetical protein